MNKDIDEKELSLSLKLLAKSSLFVLIGIILSKILAYLFRIIIARNFGPEIYGIFSLASMIVLLFYSVFSLGQINGIVRYISIYRAKGEIDKIRYLFRSSIQILLFSSIIAGIILFLTAKFISISVFHDANLIIYLQFFSIIIPFYILYSVLMSVIQAYEKIGWYSFIENILQNALKLAILVILLIIGFKTSSIIASYIFSIIFVFFAAFLVCKYKLPQIFNKFKLEKNEKRRLIRDLFSYSWPLTLFMLISYLFYWMDSFVIGYFRNASEVGYYNAAVPIASFLLLVPSLFTQLFFPLITKEFEKKNFKLIGELSKQVTKWTLALNLPLFVIMILFPGAFLNLLFGSNYIIAKNSLIFLAIGSFFSSIFLVSGNLVYVMGKSKLILMNIVFVSIFNFILAIILIRPYGISGVAFATMFSNIILNLILIFEIKYYTSIIPLRRKMLRVIFSAIPPTLALIYIRKFLTINTLTIIFQIIFFTLFYLLIILITKSLDKNDMMILKSFKDKIFVKKSEI